MTNEELVNKIVDDFVTIAGLAALTIQRSDIEVNYLPNPHRPPSSLPNGMLAVYIFFYGGSCLKVGKAGPKSTARYCSQHYGVNAPSTLAKSLLALQSNQESAILNTGNVRQWICTNTSRANLLLPATHGGFALSLLEAFVQCRLLPEFEGVKTQRSPRTSFLVIE